MPVIKLTHPSLAWTHYNPVHIISGIDVVENLQKLIPQHKILFITTKGFTNRGITAKVLKKFGRNRVIVYDHVNSYPELDDLDFLTNLYRNSGFNCILALGGGSVIDTAKVLGVTLLCHLENPLNETLRQNNPHVWNQSLPVFAVPTTSGTGAEVTPFATVWDQSTSKKYSLFDKFLFPNIALLDPTLTLTLPYKETLYTGLDAISHSLESLWNKNRTPISERLAIQSIKIAIKSFPNLLKESENLYQRKQMQISSLLAGLAISQTKTAIAHSISYPLTSYYDVPHGLACSFTLTTIAKILLNERIVSNSQMIFSLLEILESLDLAYEINKYINYDKASNLISFMITPERAGNFLRAIGKDEIDMILQESFGHQCH